MPDVFLACRDAGPTERDYAVGLFNGLGTVSQIQNEEDLDVLVALHKAGVLTKCEPVPDVVGAPGVYVEFSEVGARSVVESLFPREE